MRKKREGEEEKGRRGTQVEVRNPFLLPLAIVDVLLTAAIFALNYCLRYDPILREECSLVAWDGLQLPCSYLLLPEEAADPGASAAPFALPEPLFLSCAFAVPPAMVLLVEASRSLFPRLQEKRVRSACLALPSWSRRIPRFVCAFLMGAGAAGLMAAATKLLMASPRPYFLASCRPANASCSSSSSFSWFPEERCQGDAQEVHEALRAFPSYHATLASYSGVWTSLYLSSSSAGVPGVYGSRILMIFGVLFLSLMGSVHGLLSFRSSSYGVVAGGVLGALFALFVVYGVLNGFRETRWRPRVAADGGKNDGRRRRHPNLLPKLPLIGCPPEAREQGEFRTRLDDDDEGDDEGLFLALGGDTFPFIPRATASRRAPFGAHRPSPPPAQAFNPALARLSSPPPSSSPSSGPLPPPPSYPWADPPPWTAPYDVPRQRFSAPAGGRREPMRTPPFFCVQDGRRDSDALPRARTETASYF